MSNKKITNRYEAQECLSNKICQNYDSIVFDQHAQDTFTKNTDYYYFRFHEHAFVVKVITTIDGNNEKTEKIIVGKFCEI
jgi:tRNA splicing ligase